MDTSEPPAILAAAWQKTMKWRDTTILGTVYVYDTFTSFDMRTKPDEPVQPSNLLELLRAIEKRPAMYIGDSPRNRFSIWHLTSFVTGFQSGSIGRGPYQDGDLILDVFTFWVCTHFGVPDGQMDWASHIWHQCGKDDEAAFHKFFELLNEYVKEREQFGPEEIKNRFMQMINKR